MIVVNIHEAKTKFSMLLKESLNGEEVVIAKSGKPIAKLVPYTEKLQCRTGGQLKGILDTPENFDAPLPDDILNEFYKKDL